ncbi:MULTISPECIES: hypothetical protein [Methylomonas]|uniref:hypothetical protein n=1 Tax=Methylomonas TaxID=416 RepID=UPI0012F649DB|nr:hypothetical protein [Methylomonas koyamae]
MRRNPRAAIANDGRERGLAGSADAEIGPNLIASSYIRWPVGAELRQLVSPQ